MSFLTYEGAIEGSRGDGGKQRNAYVWFTEHGLLVTSLRHPFLLYSSEPFDPSTRYLVFLGVCVVLEERLMPVRFTFAGKHSVYLLAYLLSVSVSLS